jgi:hypothetical protein
LLETLIGYVVYPVIFAFGMRCIHVLLREGPTDATTRLTGAPAMRPMAAAGSAETATGGHTLLGCRRASAFVERCHCPWGQYPLIKAWRNLPQGNCNSSAKDGSMFALRATVIVEARRR